MHQLLAHITVLGQISLGLLVFTFGSNVPANNQHCTQKLEQIKCQQLKMVFFLTDFGTQFPHTVEVQKQKIRGGKLQCQYNFDIKSQRLGKCSHNLTAQS